MSDSWLDHGHGPNPAHLATLFSSEVDGQWPGAPERMTALEGTDRAGRRSSRLAVAAALWIAIVAGTGGAAWAVRDALFPSIGPAGVSVWQNPGRETTPASDAATSTSVVAHQPADEAPAPDVDTATSVAVEPEGPSPSVSDDRGPGHAGSTGTSVATTQSTVDDHGGQDGSNGSGNSGKSGGSGGSDDSGSGGGSGNSGSGGGSDG